MSNTIKIACATNDGINLTQDHFGEADYYIVYELDQQKNLRFIEKVKNNSIEEKMHGDPRKAASVSSLLKDMHVLLCCAMGKNVITMRKKYCPVISRDTNIERALERLKDKYNDLLREINRTLGDDREIIRI